MTTIDSGPTTPLLWGCEELPIMDSIQLASYINYGPNNYCDSAPKINDNSLSPEWTPGPFTNPVDDEAWWISETLPELDGVAGAYICRIDGLYGAGDYSREAQALAYPQCGTQYVWKAPQIATRKLEVTAWVIAKSCCGTARYIQALARKLRGCCSSGCAGGCLKVLEFTSASDNCRKWVKLTNVALTSGPAPVDPEKSICGCGCRASQMIKFTLEAADPNLYLDPIPLADITLGEPDEPCFLNDQFFFDACGCPDTSLPNPGCDALPPPEATDILSCLCYPVTAQRQFVEVNLPNSVFSYNMGVTITNTTDQPIEPLSIMWWRKNPVHAIGSGYYDLCNLCGGFSVSYLEANSILEISPYGGISIRTPGTPFKDASNRIYDISRSPSPSCINIDSCYDYYFAFSASAGVDLSGVTVEIIGSEVLT